MRGVMIWITAVGVTLTMNGTSSAQLPPVILGTPTLVNSRSVQPELKLTVEQGKKASEFFQKQGQKNRELYLNAGDDLSKYQIDWFRLYAEGMREVATFLAPEQLTRLKQICWQQAGVHALAYDEELPAKLKVTPEQKEQLRKFADELCLRIKETRGPERIAALRQEHLDKAATALTAEQQNMYKDLLGKPLPVISMRRGGAR